MQVATKSATPWSVNPTWEKQWEGPKARGVLLPLLKLLLLLPVLVLLPLLLQQRHRRLSAPTPTPILGGSKDHDEDNRTTTTRL